MEIQSNPRTPRARVPLQALTKSPSPQDRIDWTFEYDARGLPPLKNPRLKGSFDPEQGQHDPNWAGGKSVPLKATEQPGVYRAQVSLSGSPQQEFQWGVVAEGAKGEEQWMVLQEEPLKFQLGDPQPVAHYAPVSNHLYGVHQVEGATRFQTWAPALGQDSLADYRLHVDLFDDQGQLEQSLPMVKDPKKGDWSLELPDSWKSLAGKSYLYSARDGQGKLLQGPEGKPVQYADPCSRFLMGQQRGLERIFVDPVLGFETGWYNDSGSGGPNYADNPTWGRFIVDNHGEADKVQLVLRDGQGQQLNQSQLLERLGSPEWTPYAQASPEQKRDVDVLKSWMLDSSPKLDRYLWTNSVQPDGSIQMTKVDTNRTGSGWVTVVNNFPQLEGLKYEFQVYKNGKLQGDLNGNGRLDEEERRKLAYNDPYDNTIAARPGSARRSLIKESSFVPQHRDTPRLESDFRKKVIFELHLGSFLAPQDNGLPATAEDLAANLDYLVELGITDVYMMPTSEFGGKRDWGYTTDHFFAGAEAYGFEMKREQALQAGLIEPHEHSEQEGVWISGTPAIQWLNDQIHARGLDSMGDLVYNHTSGKADGDNPLWQVDGEAQSYFNWPDKGKSYTPWGPKPAYATQGVRDFFSNNSAQQVTELGFDNLRFDFTQVFHNTGDAGEQIDGMEQLRQINRTLQAVKPGTITVAEDFSRNWLVAADLNQGQQQGEIYKKGMGFQGVWNDGVRESIYRGVEGSSGEFNMDRLMHSMQNHYGVSGWDRGVLYAHSHDEVGNSGKWVGRAAAKSKDVMGPYARAAARSGAALTLTGPGMPMLWQGEEFLANNDFKHGLTSTWGYDTNWLNFKVTPDRLEVFKELAGLPASQRDISRLKAGETEHFHKYLAMEDSQRAEAETSSLRAGHFKVYQDLIKLRRSSSAFQADAPIERVYTNNQDRVIAYSRGSEQERFVVVTNLGEQDRAGYRLPLPPGRWQEVLNTNAKDYGGSGSGNFGVKLEANQNMLLPAGSTIVLKRV